MKLLLIYCLFLPLKDAAITSVLSSQWSHFWRHTPNLDFDSEILDPYPTDVDAQEADIPKDEQWYIELVNSVIQSHKALSLKKFRISFPISKSAKCVVTKWLEFVFSRRVQILDLDFQYSERGEFVLEELLREAGIRLRPQIHLIFFQSLKSLCLQRLTVSGEDIKLFLRSCPLLEILEMYWGIQTSDVEICGETLVLKCLNIHGCKGESSIKVSAPNLSCMRISDIAGKLLFESAPKLVMANFEISRSESIAKIFPSSASSYFPQLQTLNLTLWLKLPIIFANGVPVMPNLKELVIITYETYHHSLLPITALIWASPRLEEFKLTYRDDCEDHPAYMQVVTNVGRCPHQHLKVFELRMSHNQSVSEHTTEMVTYISDNCVAIRKIIISGGVDYTASRDYLTQQLLGKLPNHIHLELFN